MYAPRLPVPDASVRELAEWLREELQRISDAQHDAVTGVTFDVLHAQPDRVEAGMEVLADGTDWNPDGLGFGKFVRNEANSAWVRIGP